MNCTSNNTPPPPPNHIYLFLFSLFKELHCLSQQSTPPTHSLSPPQPHPPKTTTKKQLLPLTTIRKSQPIWDPFGNHWIRWRQFSVIKSKMWALLSDNKAVHYELVSFSGSIELCEKHSKQSKQISKCLLSVKSVLAWYSWKKTSGEIKYFQLRDEALPNQLFNTSNLSSKQLENSVSAAKWTALIPSLPKEAAV